MSKQKTLTNAELAGVIECEGLGYAIQHYMGPGSIEDPHVADLWGKAKLLMDEIESICQNAFDEAYPLKTK